ncbi:FAD-dependent oxidoreductase [Pseudomonas amygdali]|uniref:FAD-dependent oxidoreductase n=1 Tax=Pseudomonas amygdali TaxID=47877 RepID=UPI001679CAC3|nr:FAD-dependent oxidoreductase [Pseudomonas amygdali]
MKSLARRKTPLNYLRRKKAKALAMPFVEWMRDTDSLTDVVQLDDFQFVHPERVCIDAALRAEMMGAVIKNYTCAESAHRTEAKWVVNLRCEKTSECTTASADVVLNFTGVKIDDLSSRLVTPAPKNLKRKIVGVKGVSIVVKLPERCTGIGIAGINRHGEAIMCVPWGRLHYIGPTETVYQGDPDDVVPLEEDVSSIISELNYFVPGVGVGRDDVLQAWAGLRPMTYDASHPKGKRMPFSVIHDLHSEGLTNVISISWAAFMLHRQSAREILELVRTKISPSKVVPEKVPDAPVMINMTEPSVLGKEISGTTIKKAVEVEKALTIYDVFFRRTAYGWYSSISKDAVEYVAQSMGSFCLGLQKRLMLRSKDLMLTIISVTCLRVLHGMPSL